MINRQLQALAEKLAPYILPILLKLFADTNTWTPIIEGATTPGAGTYSLQTGAWTRFGNRVFYHATVVWTAHTGTGQMLVSGMPHTSVDRAGVALFTNAVTFAGAAPQARVPIAAFMELWYPVSNAAPVAINIEAAGNIQASWVIQI